MHCLHFDFLSSFYFCLQVSYTKGAISLAISNTVIKVVQCSVT